MDEEKIEKRLTELERAVTAVNIMVTLALYKDTITAPTAAKFQQAAALALTGKGDDSAKLFDETVTEAMRETKVSQEASLNHQRRMLQTMGPAELKRFAEKLGPNGQAEIDRILSAEPLAEE